VENNIKTLKT